MFRIYLMEAAPNPLTAFVCLLAFVVAVHATVVVAETAVITARWAFTILLTALLFLPKYVYFYTFILRGDGEYRSDLQAIDALRLSFTQLREIAAAQAAVRSVPAQVMTVVADRLGFDVDGPFLLTDIGGQTVRIRVDALQLSQAVMRPSSSYPSPQNETCGKEAKLLDSLRPTAGEMPKSQISLLVNGVHMGFGIRVKEDVLLLTAHQADQLDEYPGEVAIAYNGKQRLLEPRPRRIGAFPRASDLAAYRIPANMFSMLGCGVAKLGHVLSGMATISIFDDIGETVSCLGRLQRSDFKGVVEHTCWTIKGSSGAALTQNGRVVALHTGADPTGKQRNLATSMRYLETYLGEPKIVFEEDAKESYFENDRFDVDPEAEKLTRIFNEYATKHAIGPHKNHALYEAANEIASEIQELRFSQGFLELEEIEVLMDQLDLGLDHKNLARDFFSGSLSRPGSSKKTRTKLGAESDPSAFFVQTTQPNTQPSKLPFVDRAPTPSINPFDDIKESACSQESTSLANSSFQQTEHVTPQGSDSKSLEEPGRSSRRRQLRKQQHSLTLERESEARTAKEPSLSQESLRPCTCHHVAPLQSAPPSSTRQVDLSAPRIAVTTTASKRPSNKLGNSIPKP